MTNDAAERLREYLVRIDEEFEVDHTSDLDEALAAERRATAKAIEVEIERLPVGFSHVEAVIAVRSVLPEVDR